MTEINLSPRLCAAAELVRSNCFAADVGTDHAYLPIALCLCGKIRGAVASDINKGPIEKARENIEKYGLGDKISTLHTDGLRGVEAFSPDDVLILGMGGELIASIIENAPWVAKEGINLCLQPMTHAELLRKFLFEHSFEIIDERIVREGEKLYQLILASFTNEKIIPYSEEELYLGRVNIQKKTFELSALAKSIAEKLTRRAEGIESTGADTSELRALIGKIKNYQTQEN